MFNVKKTFSDAIKQIKSSLRTTVVLFCIIHSLILLVLTYVWLNLPFDYAAGEEHLNLISLAKERFEDKYQYDQCFDSILFVNIAYDKVLLPKNDVIGLPAGEEIFTDRDKLTQLLRILSENNNQKAIFIDVDFDEPLEEDSILAHYMSKVHNLYIPTTTNPYIINSSAYMGAVNGKATVFGSDFFKFPYFFDGEKSIPVLFYEKLDGGSFVKRRNLYFRNHKLSFNSIVLNFYIKKFPKYNSELENNYYDLGTDLLSLPEEIVAQKANHKIILVGDYSEYDQHNTYVGSMPGTLILLNAYLNLKKGHNVIPLVVILIFFVVYLLLSLWIVADRKPRKIVAFKEWLSEYKILSFIVEIISFSGVFLILSFFIRLMFNIYLNVIIIGIYFTLLDNIVDFIKKVRQKKKIKKQSKS